MPLEADGATIDARFRYGAFGLGIHSDIELPELSPWADATLDVTIRLGDPDVKPPRGRTTYAEVHPDEADFSWTQVARFHVEGGCEITVWPYVDAAPDLLRLPLLGIVFSALLAQRRRCVLHASAASVHGRAVCFAAPKGFGKSTLAATLHGRGHRVLADDVAAIEHSEKGAWLYPSFPQLNIWPYAAEALGLEAENLKALHSEATKCAYNVRGVFASDPLRLGAIYVLDSGQSVSLEPLRAVDSFFALVPHTFEARYMSGDSATPGYLMEAYSPLVRDVPVRRLTLSHPVHDATEAAALVEQDQQTLHAENNH